MRIFWTLLLSSLFLISSSISLACEKMQRSKPHLKNPYSKSETHQAKHSHKSKTQTKTQTKAQKKIARHKAEKKKHPWSRNTRIAKALPKKHIETSRAPANNANNNETSVDTALATSIFDEPAANIETIDSDFPAPEVMSE
jgi:hypothetical protein